MHFLKALQHLTRLVALLLLVRRLRALRRVAIATPREIYFLLLLLRTRVLWPGGGVLVALAAML
jgi:hypothetical protein